MNLKGSLSMLILQLLSGGPSHGYQIAKQIKHQSEGVLDFKEGTLYPTLHNLEKQGLLEAYTQEENSRTRRYYRITESGQDALIRERETWERYMQAVNMIMKGAA